MRYRVGFSLGHVSSTHWMVPRGHARPLLRVGAQATSMCQTQGLLLGVFKADMPTRPKVT